MYYMPLCYSEWKSLTDRRKILYDSLDDLEMRECDLEDDIFELKEEIEDGEYKSELAKARREFELQYDYDRKVDGNESKLWNLKSDLKRIKNDIKDTRAEIDIVESKLYDYKCKDGIEYLVDKWPGAIGDHYSKAELEKAGQLAFEV